MKTLTLYKIELYKKTLVYNCEGDDIVCAQTDVITEGDTRNSDTFKQVMQDIGLAVFNGSRLATYYPEPNTRIINLSKDEPSCEIIRRYTFTKFTKSAKEVL